MSRQRAWFKQSLWMCEWVENEKELDQKRAECSRQSVHMRARHRGVGAVQLFQVHEQTSGTGAGRPMPRVFTWAEADVKVQTSSLEKS